MTQKMKRILTLFLCLCLCLAVFAGCEAQPIESAPADSSASSGVDEKAQITVKIVFADGESKTLSIGTDKQFLAEALVDEGIIEYVESGLYTTVDGVTADFSVDGSWWCLYKDGAMTNDGFNTQKIADGDKFEIVYTK